jgi:uncharacterized repeat protein (TIGR03803 family)
MKLTLVSALATILTLAALESVAQVNGPGLALLLDGATGYATVTNAGVFNFTGPFTVEAWINTASLATAWQAIVTKGDSAWRLHRYQTSHAVSFGTSGLSSVDLQGFTAVDDGNWHHVAGVYDGVSKYLYVDGDLDSYTSVTGTLGTDSFPLDIGENAEQTGRVWNGEIDEVRIWNVARSQAQIQANMHLNLAGTEAGLVAYYRLDDGGGIITNSTGNAAEDGTLVGEGAWTTSTAPIGLPAIINTGLTELNASTATLDGSIAPNFQQTGWYYQYGTSTNYGSTTPVLIIPAPVDPNISFLDASQTLTGLSAATVYHFRLVATNSAGVNQSADQAFVTPSATLSTLYNFSAESYAGYFPYHFNSDGAGPSAGLNLSGNTLYGTTVNAGVAGYGTIFALHTDGTGFTNLHSLSYSDGINPYSGLTLSGGMLYGAAWEGGTLGGGTVFGLSINGAGFMNLHEFTSLSPPPAQTNADGYDANGNLLLVGGALYGMATEGGDYASGALFAVNTNGTGFTNLYSFAGSGIDGFSPQAGLVVSGHTLYGAAKSGGSNYDGLVFAINIDGTGPRNVYSFTDTVGSGGDVSDRGTNFDGAAPTAGPILSGNTLYGTTPVGGLYGNGTVFRVNTDGTGFTNLHSFTATSGSTNYYGTNSDGTTPQCGLILVGNTLYGTAEYGGALGFGAVFAINTDGSGFANLHSFGGIDGAVPIGGLVASGNTLYGTTSEGGINGSGTVFAMTLVTSSVAAIPLSIQPGNHAVILSWSNPAFSLQSAPTANGVFATVLGAVSPYDRTHESGLVSKLVFTSSFVSTQSSGSLRSPPL